MKEKNIVGASVREVITPKQASALLEQTAACGFQNRTITTSAVARYAGDITRGHWFTDTGETIKLAKDEHGREYVIDGQHRLSAVIRAQRPCAFWVFRHVPVEAYKYLDNGVSRSVEHIFQIADGGWADAPKVLASAGRMLWKEDSTGDAAKKPSGEDAESEGNIADYIMSTYPELPSSLSEIDKELTDIQRGGLGGKAWLLYLTKRWCQKDPVACVNVLDYLAQKGRIIDAKQKSLGKPGCTKLAAAAAALKEPKAPTKGWELAINKVVAARESMKDAKTKKVPVGRNVDLMIITCQAYMLAWNRQRTGIAFKTAAAFDKELLLCGDLIGRAL